MYMQVSRVVQERADASVDGMKPVNEAAQKIVDDYLLSAYQPGMTAQALADSYTSFGEDPFIVETPRQAGGVLFSAWDYARRRCEEICR
jgi:hypothetical protein